MPPTPWHKFWSDARGEGMEALEIDQEEADRSKQGNLSFSHIIASLPANSVMAVLTCHASYPRPSIRDIQ